MYNMAYLQQGFKYMRESTIYKKVAHIIDGGQEFDTQLFDIPIDIVLHILHFYIGFTIWKMTIFNKVDYIKLEPALTEGDATKT